MKQTVVVRDYVQVLKVALGQLNFINSQYTVTVEFSGFLRLTTLGRNGQQGFQLDFMRRFRGWKNTYPTIGFARVIRRRTSANWINPSYNARFLRSCTSTWVRLGK
jgi:hypothetical protein